MWYLYVGRVTIALTYKITVISEVSGKMPTTRISLLSFLICNLFELYTVIEQTFNDYGQCRI